MNKMAVYNWLIMAFSEPFNSLTETFYFDKRDKEFYSVHFADYMLLNDDLTLNEAVESPYADGVSQLIADRIYREENGDNDILIIPRLEVEKRKAIMEEFIGDIRDESLLNILQQRIRNQDGSQRFDFYFGAEATVDIKDQWELLKNARLVPVIDQFLKNNEIELSTTSVLNLGGDFSISLNL